MERDRVLSFTPVDHPDPRVQRVGFDLTDPYVEQCWSAVVGPSSVLLLRRLPALWVARVPAEIEAGELSQSLGLGPGAGDNGRFASTLQRLVRFRLAIPATDGAGLDVYRQVAPLAPRQLARVPAWTRDAHERLLDGHLEQLSRAVTDKPAHASLTARLDRLQHGSGHAALIARQSGPALGR